ncbi:MAG: M23 family metallopeptidase [Bacteroidales bacterium]|nr:M23 family metallopeptidase [Bacteroidales bacterium]
MSKKTTIIIIAAFFVVSLIVYFILKNSKAGVGGTPETEQELTIHNPKILYGINVDSFNIVKEQINRNEFLADILLKYHVDYPTIDKLARETKGVFDVRKIRYGNYYTVIMTKDSLPVTKYFAYEITPSDYVLYTFDDSIVATRGVKEISVKVDTATGIIKSSLWNAMIDNHTDPNLANELSEIYAWTIDFFGIRKDDHFKVIYESRYVEGKRIGIGKLLAANFNHFGADHYAFYFDQDSIGGDYFDEEANSLRRTFLKAPLKYRRISSGFSYSRMHPVLKYRRPHLGVDYAADRGTPVVSIGDGVVEFAKWDNGGGGRAVKIKHNGTYTTVYMHLSKYGEGIKAGAHVKQGQVIGYVGSSGLATGPHLDFRFYRNGKAVDPTKVESPAANPVDSTNMERFEVEKQKWLDVLANIRVKDVDTLVVAKPILK